MGRLHTLLRTKPSLEADENELPEEVESEEVEAVEEPEVEVEEEPEADGVETDDEEPEAEEDEGEPEVEDEPEVDEPAEEPEAEEELIDEPSEGEGESSEEPVEGDVYESAGKDGANLDEVSKQILAMNTATDDTEGEELEGDLEVTEEVIESLESLHFDLVASIESGGLNASSAKFAQRELAVHLNRIGSTLPVISNESFGMSNTRIGSTQVIAAGVEGRIADTIKLLIDGVKRFGKWVAEKVNELFGTFKSMATTAEGLLSKMPDSLSSSSVEVKGKAAHLFAGAGKLTSNASTDLIDTVKLLKATMDSPVVGIWLKAVVVDKDNIVKGDFQAYGKLEVPAYLKNASSDSFYKDKLSAGYELKVTELPLGNSELYGAFAKQNNEKINLAEVPFYSKQVIDVRKYDNEVADGKIELGNLNDIKATLTFIKQFAAALSEDKIVVDFEGPINQVSIPSTLTNDESTSEFKNSYANLRAVSNISRNSAKPHLPMLQLSTRLCKAYMTHVNSLLTSKPADKSEVAKV